MTRIAAIGIHDELVASQAAIARRSANEEPPGRVDKEPCVRVNEVKNVVIMVTPFCRAQPGRPRSCGCKPRGARPPEPNS